MLELVQDCGSRRFYFGFISHSFSNNIKIIYNKQTVMKENSYDNNMNELDEEKVNYQELSLYNSLALVCSFLWLV